MPEIAEHSYFKDLVSTYGKTFHTWQYDREDFPYGIPQLMMGFTADGQANEDLIRARDARVGVSTQTNRAGRKDIATPHVDPGANRWESGRSLQTTTADVPFRSMSRSG